jgi:hypothetical protein
MLASSVGWKEDIGIAVHVKVSQSTTSFAIDFIIENMNYSLIDQTHP